MQIGEAFGLLDLSFATTVADRKSCCELVLNNS